MRFDLFKDNIQLSDDSECSIVIDYVNKLFPVEKAAWVALTETINSIDDGDLGYLFGYPLVDKISSKLKEVVGYINSSYNTPEEKVAAFNNIAYYMLNYKYPIFREKLIILLKQESNQYYYMITDGEIKDYIFEFDDYSIITNGILMFSYSKEKMNAGFSTLIIHKKEFLEKIN